MTEDIHFQAATYALGALPDDETPEFETHLAECPECQDEVAAIRDVTAELSESVATAPPPALRDAIMTAIAETPQEPADDASAELAALRGRHAVDSSTWDTASRGTSAWDSADDGSNVVPLRRSWGSRASALVAAAAVIAAVGFGGWALQQRDEARDDAQIASDQAEQLAQVLSADDVQTASAPITDGGTATVVRSQSQGIALLVAADLPDLPDGQVYEAWTIDGDPLPAGTFEPEGEHTTFALTPAALDTGTVAVTVEPAGGSDAPTTDPIVAITMTDA